MTGSALSNPEDPYTAYYRWCWRALCLLNGGEAVPGSALYEARDYILHRGG
jgi:hypothetical protein